MTKHTLVTISYCYDTDTGIYTSEYEQVAAPIYEKMSLDNAERLRNVLHIMEGTRRMINELTEEEENDELYTN